MGLKITNNAYAILAAGAASSDTSITLTAGQGARFPTLGASDFFYATLVDTGNNLEIVKCTARVSDVLTVVRGQDSTTARNYIVGDRIEIRPVAALFDSKQNVIAVGTVGQVLVSNGTEWVAGAAPGFPAGTRMSFQQSTPPTGWTKDTTAAINDAILRLVTGSVTSGGSIAFSTFNGQSSVGATTLSTAQEPSHTHNGVVSSTIAGAAGATAGGSAKVSAYQVGSTGAAGGGGSHTHSISTPIKYYDFIIASKD